MFPAALTVPAPRHAGHWPVLAQDRLLLGDIRLAAPVPQAVQWKGQPAPTGAHALLMVPPATVLAGLTGPRPTFSALAYPRTDLPGAAPAALLSIPPIEELLYGARPGGIGETCALVILVAGLYLMYRNYVRWHLPVSFLLAAAAVAAIAPVRLAGAGEEVRTVWLPLTFEGFDVGFTYVNYQLLSGGILLAAFFLATEMTTRPVTPNGQVVFGLGCGALAMALQLNLPARGLGLNIQTPIPAYVAVLAMNTLTPWIENIWRPRVLGQKRFLWVFRKDA